MSTTKRWLPWIVALGAGCGEPDSPTGGGEATASGAASTTGGSSGGTAIGGSSDDAPQPSTTTAEPSTTESGSTGPGTDESSTGEETIQFCGLEDLKPGAPNPIVSGTEPMQIPPDIGTILADNCGCHYADMLDVGPPVADYSHLLPLRIETWEQWQGEYGILTLKPTLDTCLTRVRDAPLQTAMPHRSCNVGGGEQMDPGQRQVLIDWMEAGAPDGATWIPP